MSQNKIELPKLPMGVSDFNELITQGYLFVDKTNFIKDVMKDGAKVILLTRPRRFGKTLTLSMLYYFLQCQQPLHRNLFENLSISQDKSFCDKHQNKYPVIFISFKEIKQSSYEGAYAEIVTLIRSLYAEHRYLLENDVLAEDEKKLFHDILNQRAMASNIHESIRQLSIYLDKKFGAKPMILIDEYDAPIQIAYLEGYYEPMIKLMRSIFGYSLKDNTNTHFSKGVVTGIARIAQESLFSGVNNFEAYSVLKSKYGQYFGFTEPEVIDLINKTGNTVKLDIVKEWYNGYKIGSHLVYNPWSIIMCLKNDGDIGPHWLNTSNNDLVRTLLEKGGFRMRSQFELLLQGENAQKPLMENLVFPDLENDEEAVWSLLLYAGYLTSSSTSRDRFALFGLVSVPNKEVMCIYDKIISKWFKISDSLESYRELVKALLEENMDELKRHIQEYLLESGSYFDFNQNTPEKVFQGFMLGLVIGLKDHYTIQSNQESGLGRFDIVFIPKENERGGILLEFKVGSEDNLVQKANEALQQIKDKKYLITFKSHGVKSVLAIGMAFCGKQVEIAHESIEVE